MSLITRSSHFFVTNRAISSLVLIIIVLFGALSFWLTPKQYNPEISRPAFVVGVPYYGATTDQAIERVARQVIEAIGVIPGVEDVYTTVTDGAVITTTAIFAVGTDATEARVQLWTELLQREERAQGLIGSPTITVIDPETIPVLQIAVSSPVVSIAEVREAVQRLVPVVLAVPGVSEVTVTGGYQPRVTIELDPIASAANGLSVTDITAHLANASQRRVLLSSGGNAPVIPRELQTDTADLAMVAALPLTPTLRLRDVAEVRLGPAGARSFVRYHRTSVEASEVVMVAVAKVAGVSAPVVTEAVLDTLQPVLTVADVPLTMTVVADDGAVASTEIGGLSINLLTSIVIVAGVLWLFLSTRAAIMVLLAIPLTLLVVFIVGWLFEQTINRITLFALILSLGLLVDSAIVVTENIYRRTRLLTPTATRAEQQYTIAAAVGEIGIGLLLSTITSVIVFLPMLYITGMMGPYMGPIAFFVPAALIVSLLVALFLTPVLATWLLPAGGVESRPNWFVRQLDRLTKAYQTFLAFILQSRRRQRVLLRAALGLFLVALVLPATGLVHFQMLPRADRDHLYVYIDLPLTTPVAATDAFVAELVPVLWLHEAVTSIQSFVGTPPVIDFNGLFKGADQRTGAHQATLRINLTAAASRQLSSTAITSELRTLVHTALADQAATVRFMEEPPGPPVQATFVARVRSSDQVAQEEAATTLLAWLTTIPGVVDRFRTPDTPVLRAVQHIDATAAATHGVTFAEVEQIVSLQAAPQVVGEWLQSPSAEQTPIHLTIPAPWQSSVVASEAWPVVTQTGTTVPLGTVVQTTYQSAPLLQTMEGSLPVTYVTAEVEGRSIVYVMIEIMYRLIRGDLAEYRVTNWNLFGMTLVAETGEMIEFTWGGEWEMTLENFRDLGVAMGVALVLVYLVLVAQYRTFATPAYILVTIPLGLVGILAGFTLLDQGFGIYLTATALIGFIALIGIVVNNAIIYLEAVTQARAASVLLPEALVTAGGARLRPIILTSLTTILGSLTIASDPVWSGLAWAIVFGLSLSTVLTLIVYPTLLIYFRVDPGRARAE